MRCPLAGGEIGAEDVVEDNQHDPSHHLESIYAVPWNQGQHDMTTTSSTVEDVCAKDGPRHLCPDRLVTAPCNRSAICKGAELQRTFLTRPSLSISCQCWSESNLRIGLITFTPCRINHRIVCVMSSLQVFLFFWLVFSSGSVVHIISEPRKPSKG